MLSIALEESLCQVLAFEGKPFNPLKESLPEWYRRPCQIVSDMLLNGVTCWDNPYFEQGIQECLSEWVFMGHLIKVRLISEWLLSAMPKGYSENLLMTLCSLADGDFCTVFEGKNSLWPRKPGYYKLKLDLRMAEIAQDYFEVVWPTAFKAARLKGVEPILPTVRDVA